MIGAHWALEGEFQQGAVGASTLQEPDYSTPVMKMTIGVTDPVGADLQGLSREVLDTAAGCMQVCGSVSGDSVTFELPSDVGPWDAMEGERPEGSIDPDDPPPSPTPPPAVDSDGDGYTWEDGDCNGDDAEVHPGATELCDGADNDCDGAADEGFDAVTPDGVADCQQDSDGDGSSDLMDCAPTSSAAHPGAAEGCDGIDNDCDAVVDEGSTNTDGDAQADCVDPDDDGDLDPDTTDCAPTDAARASTTAETCDGVDNNCAGVDEGFANTDGDAQADCVDADDDGDLDPDTTDCATTDAAVWTGAPESCDGVDQDCDGSTAGESTDGDGDGLMDACDAHPALGCPCFTLADVQAVRGAGPALCLLQDTTGTVPDTTEFTGAFIDWGAGVFEIAGTAVLGDGSFACANSCFDNPPAVGSCSAVGRPPGGPNLQIDAPTHQACEDVAAAGACP